MNISLTLVQDEVMRCLGPMVDVMIEHEHELTSPWYGFVHYLSCCLEDISLATTELPYSQEKLVWVCTECLDSRIAPVIIHHWYNLLYRRYHDAICQVYQYAYVRGESIIALDGLWEEPIGNHHPALVFSSAQLLTPRPGMSVPPN